MNNINESVLIKTASGEKKPTVNCEKPIKSAIHRRCLYVSQLVNKDSIFDKIYVSTLQIILSKCCIISSTLLY